jgi:hypothetical protein
MEPKGPLLRSQQPTTGPCPEPDAFSPHPVPVPAPAVVLNSCHLVITTL